MKTKIKFWIPVILLALSSLFLVTNCTKDDDVTSEATIPVLITNEVAEITQTTATSGGNVTSDGGATIIARGVCWSTNLSPTIADNKTTDGTGIGSFTSAITGLTANTTYYVRAYATNSAGTSYGSTISFTTLEGNTTEVTIPVLTTNAVTELTQTTAISGGNVTSDGGATIIARGVCWSTSQTPTITDIKTTDGTGIGSFTSAITGLTANTTYYVRAYATNSAGTGYGNSMSFTTLEENITVTDLDGNLYNTITIGTQTWMVENLKVTQYNDGTNIPNETDATAWNTSIAGAYCNYNNQESNVSTYGRLYNWDAVNTGKLCPIGWHVPTDSEWTILTNYLGGIIYAGGKLKENGTIHWTSPNEAATNETGFSALPSGYRDYDGTFNDIRIFGNWWSSTWYDSSNSYAREMNSYDGGVMRYYRYISQGLSVRCVKD